MANQKNTPGLFIPITPEQQRELADIKARFLSLAMEIMDTNQIPVDLLEVYPETSNLDALYEQLSDLGSPIRAMII